MAKFFYIAFLFLSFISLTISGQGEHLFLSRLTVADVVGLLALLFTFPKFIEFFKTIKRAPKVYLAAFSLAIGFVVTSIFSLYPVMTVFEAGIVIFLIFISLGVYITFRNESFIELLTYLMWATIIFTGIGFYDLFAEQYEFYRIFPLAKYPGVLVGGFKNTGQAGSFFMMIFIMLTALRFSLLSEKLSMKQNRILNISLGCCLITFVALGKYSVIYGLLIGITLLVIYLRRWKVLKIYVGTIIVLICFIGLIKISLPDTYGRIGFKFENRVINTELTTNETGFIESNFRAAFTSFKEHPITGCGLGTFQCQYHTHEVHSTYFKMLGEAGLIGVVLYLLFIISFLKLFPISRSQSSNPYAHYLQLLLPLLIGAFITWVYTYHLRKREFWILVAIVVIAAWKGKKYKLKLSN